MSRLIQVLSEESGVPPAIVAQLAESLLEKIHKGLIEHREGNRDYLGERAPHELARPAYWHLLGIIETVSRKYNWDPGTIVEYLGRLPPVEDWEEMTRKTVGWQWDEPGQSPTA